MTIDEAKTSLEAKYKATAGLWVKLVGVTVGGMTGTPTIIEVIAKPMLTTPSFRLPEAEPVVGWEGYQVSLWRQGVKLSDSGPIV